MYLLQLYSCYHFTPLSPYYHVAVTQLQLQIGPHQACGFLLLLIPLNLTSYIYVICT